MKIVLIWLIHASRIPTVFSIGVICEVNERISLFLLGLYHNINLNIAKLPKIRHQLIHSRTFLKSRHKHSFVSTKLLLQQLNPSLGKINLALVSIFYNFPIFVEVIIINSKEFAWMFLNPFRLDLKAERNRRPIHQLF